MTAIAGIILNNREVRELLERGLVDVCRKAVRNGRRHVGEQLWVRETFATRADGETIRIRYKADFHDAPARVVPATGIARRYRSARYFTRAGKYCPRWASRLLVQVLDMRIEPGPDGDLVLLSLKRVDEATPEGVTG